MCERIDDDMEDEDEDGLEKGNAVVIIDDGGVLIGRGIVLRINGFDQEATVGFPDGHQFDYPVDWLRREGSWPEGV